MSGRGLSVPSTLKRWRVIGNRCRLRSTSGMARSRGRSIAHEAAGWQVVFGPGRTCRLTLELHEARWLAALEAVLRACGLGSEEEGGVVRVAPLSRLREEMAARQKLEDQRRRRPSGKLQLFRLSYARAEKMAPLLERFLSPEGRVGKECRSRWSPYH